MMKILITLSIALVSSASARIGETPQECTARYGSSVHVDKENQSIIYQKAGFNILITFWKGKAHELYIQKNK